MQKRNVKKVAVPLKALSGYVFEPVHYADAFQVRLPQACQPDMSEWAHQILGKKDSFPGYVTALLYLRDFLVKPFGIKTAADLDGIANNSDWIGFFRIYHKSENEIILGDDDRHLDFRVSLLRAVGQNGRVLTISTFVRFHNPFGRIYFTLIKPFHQVIISDTLKKAVL